MATATTSTHAAPPDEHVEEHGGAHDDHPSEKKYWIIALILGIVTAIEVALSYIDLGDAVAPLLLLGMVIKFFIVASYFMHLKFDSKVTRRLFISGLSLALFCYLGMFMMFRQFGPRNDRQDINLIESGVPQR
jgi:cytochrome c oxidase subunit 4